jgi:hypothetical protein
MTFVALGVWNVVQRETVNVLARNVLIILVWGVFAAQSEDEVVLLSDKLNALGTGRMDD